MSAATAMSPNFGVPSYSSGFALNTGNPLPAPHSRAASESTPRQPSPAISTNPPTCSAPPPTPQPMPPRPPRWVALRKDEGSKSESKEGSAKYTTLFNRARDLLFSLYLYKSGFFTPISREDIFLAFDQAKVDREGKGESFPQDCEYDGVYVL
jgi:hypothetical protein